MRRPAERREPGARLTTRFRDHGGGASAVEFALILPIALAMLVAMAEFSHAIDSWRKTTQLARTVADLTSQGDTVNPMASGTMNDILASSATVMQPFSGTDAAIVVSALAVDLTASVVSPRVCSSIATSNTRARATGLANDLTIPAGFAQTGARYVLAEVTFPYTPMLGGSLTRLVGGFDETISFKVGFPWPTRGGTTYNGTTTEVILPGGSQCP